VQGADIESNSPVMAASSGRKDLAASAPARGKHTPAVLGGHALTESMHFAALAFLGLVGTLHRFNLSLILPGISDACPKRWITPLAFIL
jgi:hypothetical protein